MKSDFAALVAALLCLTVGPLGAQATEDPYDPAFIPRGVYWPGEYSFGEPYDAVKIGAALTQLQSLHVNTIWFTHKGAAFTAELARQAAPYGISLVASLDIFAGNEVNVRGRTDTQHIGTINSVLSTWGDAPQPLAWGLGDEADPANADYQRWAAVWNSNFPTQPTTAVHMWNQIDAAQANLAYQKSLTCDVYPFRPGASGAGGFPGGPVKGLDRSTRHVVNSPASMRPWMMVAAYQERHSGPTYYDAAGNYCYGPNGAATHFAVSRAQARWQAWKSIANGAKGVFFFAYRLENWMNQPGAAASTASWRYVNGFNTGEPAGLVYTSGTKSGQPSSACLGMGDAYAKIHALSPLLGGLELIKAPEAWLTGAAATDGPHLAVFRDPQTGARHLLVLAGHSGAPDTPKNITFKVGPHITGLAESITGNTVPLAPDGQGCGMATASLLPGDAVFYSCTVDAGNMPVSYFDDFETNRHQTDSVAWTQVSTTNNYSGYGRCLQATTGSGASSNHVVYDLDNLLAPLPAGGLRVLQYDGDSTAADRGAFWWKGNTTAFGASAWSSNAFNSEVPAFTDRYLRVGIARTDGASYAYGNMNRFGIAQWATTSLPADPSSFQWNGGSTTDAGWNQAANWNTTPVFDPTTDIVFHATGAARLSTFLQSARTIRSLTFNALSDSDVTIRTTTTATGTDAADLVFDAAVGSASITVDGGAGGNHTLGTGGGGIVLNDDLVVTHNGSGTLTLGRPVSGTFSLTKSGSGVMVLSAANNFSGSTTINDGTLDAQVAGALGSTGDVTVETTGSGTRLKLGNSSCLAFSAHLHVNSGGEAGIDLTGNNHVAEFTIDGVPQPAGRWGRPGHPLADHSSDTFTGDGLLGVGVLPSVSWHVTTAGADTNTGTGWDDAFLTLSKALAEANAAVALGASNATIYVGAGTFQSTGELLLDAAITIVGGNQPDFEGQAAIIRGKGATGNFRVFRLTHPAARLEGLTIENGYSGSTSSPNPGTGGNIRMSAGTVANCLIRNGTVRDGAFKGAGIFMSGGTVEDCRILNNKNWATSKSNTAYGGGVYQTGGELRRCRVGANYFDIGSSTPASITVHGAGICVDGAGAIVESCLIDNNYAPNNGTANSAGGGIYLTTSGGTVRNCTITENEVRKTTVTHTGGGLWQAGGTVLNTIVAGNTVAATTPGDYANGGSLRDITHSCAPELSTGTGNNLTTDPRFASPSTGDFRLAAASPCLDTGLDQPWMSTASDLDRNPRLVGTIDIGAYEAPAVDPFTGWFTAYPSITGADRTPDLDFDGDGLPNGIEFVIGSNPETSTGPSTPGYPVLTVSGGNVTYAFKRVAASQAYAVHVDVSTDLATWPTSYLIPPGDGTDGPVTVAGEDVTVTLPLAPDAKKFLRLRAVIPFTP